MQGSRKKRGANFQGFSYGGITGFKKRKMEFNLYRGNLLLGRTLNCSAASQKKNRKTCQIKNRFIL